MSIEKKEDRFCIGSYNLDTFFSAPCHSWSSLEKKAKDNYCNDCKLKNGFNPAFYNTKAISPQQERYNDTPHVVYLAFFSPTHIKAGIASEKRHLVRLLEQGARAAVILERFPNAYLARKLESELCLIPEIIESLTSALKLKLLIENSFDFNQAEKTLRSTLDLFYGENQKHNQEIVDLSPHYLYGRTLSASSKMYMADEKKDSIIAGRLIGMIGDLVIVSQSASNNDVLFPIPIKKYISHIVRIYMGEIIAKYSREPKQLTLW